MARFSFYRRFLLVLVAIWPLTLPVATAAQDRRPDNCENEAMTLEAPLVQTIMEEAQSAERGRDQPVDLGRAALLYCEAASYGSLEAQYRLGKMALNGRGLPRDVSVASTLFSIASDNGHQAARAMLLLTGEREPKLPDCLAEFQAGRRPYPMQEGFILKLITQLNPRGR